MSDGAQIIPLEVRRQLLLERSEQFRRELSAEMDNLGATTAWIDRGYSMIQRMSWVWPVVATVAGLLVARKRGSIFQNAAKLWSVWKFASKLIGMWRQRGQSGAQAEEPAQE